MSKPTAAEMHERNKMDVAKLIPFGAGPISQALP
jgi:hypothetical protein